MHSTAAAKHKASQLAKQKGGHTTAGGKTAHSKQPTAAGNKSRSPNRHDNSDNASHRGSKHRGGKPGGKSHPHSIAGSDKSRRHKASKRGETPANHITQANKALSKTAHIFIRPAHHELDAFTEIENITKYKSYEVLNTQGDKILFAVDVTQVPFYAKICPCIASPIFKISVLSFAGHQVFIIIGNMGNQTVEVQSSMEEYGCVKQESSMSSTDFAIAGFDQSGNKAFIINKDPTNPREFKVLSSNGMTAIGKVTDKWIEPSKKTKWYSKHDTFGVSFPVNQNVKTKVLFLGAGVLLYFKFFEGRTAHV